MREGIGREFGMDMYTLLYLKWLTNKALLYSTGNSAQCFVVTQMEEGFGKNGSMYIYGVPSLLERMDPCIYMESLHCSPETITTLLISYCCCSVTKAGPTLWPHGQ